MRFPFLRLGLALAALALLGVAPVRADVVFSNLGPGDSFGPGFLSVRGPSAAGGERNIAQRFTVTGGDFIFTSAELALRSFTAPSPLTIRLMEDAGGLPGATLETMQVTVPAGASLVTAASATNPLLLNGQTYWIGTDAGTDAGDHFQRAWHLNNQGQSGNSAANSGGPWFPIVGSPDAAYRVSGDPVTAGAPEALIRDLIALLKSYGLPKGIENSYLVKLEAALSTAEEGDTAGAIARLETFIHHVQAQSGKKLTVGQAQELTTAAQDIIGLLGLLGGS